MRTPTLSITLVFLLFSLFGCDQATPPPAPAELILGKWSFEKLELPADVMDKAQRHERAEFEQMQFQMKVMRYNFFKDGTYSMDFELSEEFKNNIERGNYRLINDGAVLVTEHKKENSGETKTSELNVLRLTPDTLLLSEQSGKADMLFVRSN